MLLPWKIDERLGIYVLARRQVATVDTLIDQINRGAA